MRLSQADPSRTATLRRAFSQDMHSRFLHIDAEIRQFVVKDDVFALRPRAAVVVHIQPRAFEFRSLPEKVEGFRDWLKEQTAAGILEVDNFKNEPWLNKYITSAYKKGKLRSYKEKYGDLLTTPEGLKLTDSGRLLGFGLIIGPEEVRRLEAIYTRAWTDLKGINDAMAQQLSRILANGLADGKNPLEIAREMTQTIEGLSKKRAELIARTEVIAAQAEGQLDAYAALGEERVYLLAEFQHAGDDRVCPICYAHGEPPNNIMTIEEARGLIPLHPDCRCAWAPVSRLKGQ